MHPLRFGCCLHTHRQPSLGTSGATNAISRLRELLLLSMQSPVLFVISAVNGVCGLVPVGAGLPTAYAG